MSADSVVFAKALADDTRQEIMTHLCCVWLSVNDIVDRLGGRVNQPTVSHHLKKLEEAGLVEVMQQGRQRFYTLNRRQVRMCCGVLVHQFAPEQENSVVPVREVGVWSAPFVPAAPAQPAPNRLIARRQRNASRRQLRQIRELLES